MMRKENGTPDPNIENIRNLLPRLSKKVLKDQLQTLTIFMEMVNNNYFLPSNIYFLCFLVTVKLYYVKYEFTNVQGPSTLQPSDISLG